MEVVLRAEQPDDLALLTGGESPFDAFGPQGARTTVRPSRLDGDGALVVIDGELGVAGEVSWHWKQWGPNTGSRCPMVGIWLRRQARGRGVGRAAQSQLAALFFAHTTTNRVEAHSDVENVAEQRALEAAGFTREGVVRGSQWRDGTHHDGYLYAIVRDDPRPAH